MAYVISKEKCTGCGKCIAECPVEAISQDGDKCVIDPEKCVGCGVCAGVCGSEAISEA